MIICKEIAEYLRYAEDHPKWINNDRRLLIENIVMPTMRRNDVFFDEKTYQNCLKYCEKHYYSLFPYQKFIYAFAFMYVDDMPLFPKFFIMMGRGNGKDGFIVPLVNFFQTPLYGVKNYHVEIVANAEDQAKDTFNVAYEAMDKQCMKGKFKVTKELIKNNATGSELKYNTSNAETKDGKRPGCLVLNEIHAYENYDRINVFESGLGKVRHPREFIITTNGYVREGPLDDLLGIAREILRTGENPLGYFPFICTIDDKSEVDDEDAWHKANPSMEYMPILANQIKHDYLEMQMLPSKRPEFMTKRMNWPDRNDEETVTSWDNILRCCYSDIKRKIPREVPKTKGKMAILAFDYADVRDFASAGVLTEENGEFVWKQHTWICEQSPFLASIKFPIAQNFGMPEFQDYEVVQGPTIPPDLIVQWCMARMAEYTVMAIAADTYRFSMFRTLFKSYGIAEYSKQQPWGLVRLVRKIGSVCGIIAPDIERMFAEGHIIYGPSAIMRWYTNNTEVKTDKYGNKQFSKIEPKLRKNDGFMAFVVAMYYKELIKEKVMYV